MRIILLVGVFLFSLLPQAQAAIFWESLFNNQDCSWRNGFDNGCLEVNSGPVQIATDIKHEGAGSVKYFFDFPLIGSCLQPHINFTDNCEGYWNRTFTPSTTLWQRFWLYIGDDFVGSNPYTKITKIGANGFSDWLTFTQGNSTGLVMHNQGWPTAGETRLLFTTASVTRGTWACIEAGRTLNTPGVANGTFFLYQDGVQKAAYTDVGWRLSGDNTLVDYARLYRQYGGGTLRIDQYAVGDTRIGCGGGAPPIDPPPPPPPADTSPPNAPTNLTVTELWEDLKALVASVWSWLGPATAEAATNDRVTITWPEVEPGTLYELRWQHVGHPDWMPLGLVPSEQEKLVLVLDPPVACAAGQDCWRCADGRAIRDGQTGRWLSETAHGKACSQFAVTPVTLPPLPDPEPVELGPAIVTMSGDKIYIACDPTRYTKADTTGRGTKRVITCLK